jgi:hypothetical protein
MAQLHPILTTLLSVGFLSLLSYCAITYTNAASYSLRHAQIATGSLSVSRQQLTLQFQTQQPSPHQVSPPVRIAPKPHQTTRAMPHRCVSRHR